MFSSNTSQVSGDATYIEDVFSTYLYTGNSTARSITNNIDLSTKGGMVWFKARNVGSNHYQVDTARGNTKYLASNSTTLQMTFTDALTAFTTTGFNLGVDAAAGDINGTGYNMASWTFREQPKFFDVVTYTGNGVAGTQIPHSLGSTPGCIMVKRCAGPGGAVDWAVWHNQLGGSEYLKLNTTDAGITNAAYPPFGAVTSTYFTVGNASATGNNGLTNSNGDSFVAYVFAHNAGGFGLTGTDNVISCGSFTTDGSGNAAVSLGYEPQWVLIKQTDGVDSWYLNDNMRGMAVSGNQPNLSPNLSAAESAGGYNTYPNATGFTASVGIASKNYIYIAIRRGPMKVPTSANDYFAPVTRVGNGGNPTISGGITDDAAMIFRRPGSTSTVMVSRLTANPYLETVNTNAQNTDTLAFPANTWDVQQGLKLGGSRPIVNSSGVNYIDYHFRRAPNFFDEVCWTADGTGGAITLNHNLTVTPELLFYKRRSGGTGNWFVYAAPLGLNGSLNLNNSDANPGYGRVSAVSATTFTTDPTGNTSGATYIARLFATCPKVSKVGSYVGSSSDVTVDCGFTSGARFVLIRRILFGTTPDTGNWWVFDSARGMTTSSDPAFLLNSTAAEFSGNYVDQTATGFVAKAGNSETNAANQTYIYLAIA